MIEPPRFCLLITGHRLNTGTSAQESCLQTYRRLGPISGRESDSCVASSWVACRHRQDALLKSDNRGFALYGVRSSVVALNFVVVITRIKIKGVFSVWGSFCGNALFAPCATTFLAQACRSSYDALEISITPNHCTTMALTFLVDHPLSTSVTNTLPGRV